MKHLFELEIGNAEYYACSGSEEHGRKSEVTVRQCEEDDGGKLGEEKFKGYSSFRDGLFITGSICAERLIFRCATLGLSMMRQKRFRQIYGVFRAAFRCGRIFLQPRFDITGIDAVQSVWSIEPV